MTDESLSVNVDETVSMMEISVEEGGGRDVLDEVIQVQECDRGYAAEGRLAERAEPERSIVCRRRAVAA